MAKQNKTIYLIFVVVYYCSIIVYCNFPGIWRWIIKMWPQFWKAVPEPVICHPMFWMVYLIVLVKNVYEMMTFETTDHIGELSNKTVLARWSIFDCYPDGSDYENEEQRTVLSMPYSKAHVTCWLLYFRKITSWSKVLNWNEFVNFAANSLGML